MPENTESTADNGSGELARASDGKFGLGNKFARGNPYHRRVKSLRFQIVRFLDRGKIWDIAEMLYRQAIDHNDVMAARELLDRGLGKATQPVELEGSAAISAIGTSDLAAYFAKRQAEIVEGEVAANEKNE